MNDIYPRGQFNIADFIMVLNMLIIVVITKTVRNFPTEQFYYIRVYELHYVSYTFRPLRHLMKLYQLWRLYSVVLDRRMVTNFK